MCSLRRHFIENLRHEKNRIRRFKIYLLKENMHELNEQTVRNNELHGRMNK